jgi:hypothetical protein
MTEQEWTDFLARTEGHTPGPLTIKTAGNGDNAVVSFDIDANGRSAIVAETFAGIRRHDEDARQEAKANAELYAAAPTLKDEVTRLREALEGIGVVTDCPKAKHLCRKALKGGEA